jgi:hypothetical protein
VAFAGALFVPLGLAGMMVKSRGGPVAVFLALAAIAFPLLMIAVALGTDRFADFGLRRAGLMLQRLVVLVVAVGLVSPVLIVMAALPREILTDGANALG